RENKNGFLVEPGDPEQLAQKIMTLLKDPELAEELGKCGRNLVEEKFAWPLITNQVVDLYQRISNTS
ncbi:MAG: glycosyltransferase, partial [Candidatus Bathyarchaeota archaeon]